jgi:beta-lactamase class D
LHGASVRDAGDAAAAIFPQDGFGVFHRYVGSDGGDVIDNPSR